MAGMEELEIHSKSYLVRWIHVKAEHTISWSIQPHKKSLNFGIFKHPGHSALTANLPASDSHSTDSSENLPSAGAGGSRHHASAPVIEKLTGIGLKPIKWIGKCEADRISQGTYDVPPHEDGNYALVFDNTFSKQTSKTVTLVLITYPTAVPPQSGHRSVRHLPAATTVPANNAGGAGGNPGGAPSLRIDESTESLKQSRSRRRSTVARSNNTSSNNGNNSLKVPSHNSESSGDIPTVHTGILQKRRRKRHQGWARRFFTLDFKSSTLSYYHDRNSSALRGAIPLSLAAVAANESTREISVDSGAEIWHLRASNDQDFISWKRALERASKAPPAEDNHQHAEPVRRMPSLRVIPTATEEREWAQVEKLASQISESRDAVLRLAKDTDPKYFTPQTISPSERSRGRSPSPSLHLSPHTTEPNSDDYFDPRDRRPFWKRKASVNSSSGVRRGPASPQLTVPAQAADAASITGDRKPDSIASYPGGSEDIHDRLMTLLRDLDHVVSEFSLLIADRNERRRPSAISSQSRLSMESDISQEFFDAMDGVVSPILTIHDSDDDNAAVKQAETVADDVSSDSDDEDLDTSPSSAFQNDSSSSLFPTKPKSLTPLPLSTVVQRRTNITAPTIMPPSLIGFLRKNVGKDLSQISMPVSANEPLSLLQRAAEVMEYSNLLDKAASATDTVERLMYVTAFAISSLSNNRVRERAIRKPFNPMLGETYELVREDRGFRFIAEKVSHRPVQLAYQAESKDWSITQSPMPTQKFWGKSAEIITEGKIRLTLHTSAEYFSWSSATSFLRNIIAGEKYVEPAGELSVLNETTGQKTISTFKAGGMFSGRSEDVSSKAFDSYGNELPLGLVGTWTTSLDLIKNGSLTNTAIWTVAPLVPDAPKHYGLTSFAATLNEVTPIEDKKLPPTDSRLRPDQRALEDGDVDRAEEEKVKLEENQRARRREMEAAGKTWIPRWFTQVEDEATTSGEIVWRLKTGKEGYWEERARGAWTGVVPVFKL